MPTADNQGGSLWSVERETKGCSCEIRHNMKRGITQEMTEDKKCMIIGSLEYRLEEEKEREEEEEQ